MPLPRRYTNQAERQAAYRERLAAVRQRELQAKGFPRLPAIPTVPGWRRWAVMQDQARLLLQTVQDEMQDYCDQRSEVWQASERGEMLAECQQAIQEAIGALEGASP